MNNKKKTYTAFEVAIELKKSLYKVIANHLKSKKEIVKDIVDDLKDPDNKAKVPSEDAPSSSATGTLNKSIGPSGVAKQTQKPTKEYFTIGQTQANKVNRTLKNKLRSLRASRILPKKPRIDRRSKIKGVRQLRSSAIPKVKGVQKLKKFVSKKPKE